MPVTGKYERINEEGTEKEAFIAVFTNGVKEQLAELAEFFKQENEIEVLKLAISFLVNVQEDQKKRNENS